MGIIRFSQEKISQRRDVRKRLKNIKITIYARIYARIYAVYRNIYQLKSDELPVE